MFEKILISPNQSRALPVNLGLVLESLFFYQKTILHLGRNEISELVTLMDIDTFINFLKRPEIEVYYKNSHAGVIMGDDPRILSVNTFSHNNFDIEKQLFEIYFNFSKDKQKSEQFAKRVSPLIKVYYLPDDFSKIIAEELNNESYRKAVLKETLNYHNPTQKINIEDIQFDLEVVGKDPFSQDLYKVHSNLNFDQYSMTPSGILLNVVNGSSDLYIASEASSEIILPEINSSILRAKVIDILKQTDKSKQEIVAFNHYIYDGSIQIKEAINKGRNVKEFFPILDKAQKQKHWLGDLPNNSNLLKEYIKKSSEKTWLENEKTKAVRFYLFNGINTILGAAFGLTGVGIGIGLSAFNSFVLDKLVKKWKPNQFIDEELLPALKK